MLLAVDFITDSLSFKIVLSSLVMTCTYKAMMRYVSYFGYHGERKLVDAFEKGKGKYASEQRLGR